MLQRTKFATRVLALMGALALIGTGENALAQGTTARKFESTFAGTGRVAEMDSATLINEYPLALVYRGLSLFEAKDYEGAINAWRGYLERAGKGADTVSINEMIHEAWIHEYPLSLVYEGIGRYVNKDVAGAVGLWNRYIELAADGDTTEVRKMIDNALVPNAELTKVRAPAQIPLK